MKAFRIVSYPSWSWVRCQLPPIHFPPETTPLITLIRAKRAKQAKQAKRAKRAKQAKHAKRAKRAKKHCKVTKIDQIHAANFRKIKRSNLIYFKT